MSLAKIATRIDLGLIDLKIKAEIIRNIVSHKISYVWNEPGNRKTDVEIARKKIAEINSMFSITQEVIDNIALEIYCMRLNSEDKRHKATPENCKHMLKREEADLVHTQHPCFVWSATSHTFQIR